MTGGAVTVSAEQIAKAKARGIINVEPLAAACERYSFPFYLALTIVERESPDKPKVTGITGGANIFGHDRGGALTDPDGKNIQVTEARYKKFLELIGAGHTSNGVGPMQLTYKGYHIGPVSLQAKGLKGWLAADTMLYGVEILAKSLKRYYDRGMSLEKAFWHTGRDYNNSDTYADAVVERSKFWLTVVGNPDTKPTDPGEDMPITDADIAKIKAAVIAELFTKDNKLKLAEAVWTAELLHPGSDNKDKTDKTWQPRTFLITTYNRVAELLKRP